MKTRRKLEKLWIGAGIPFWLYIVAKMGIMGTQLAEEEIGDYLHEIPQEVALEERIGTPIYFDFSHTDSVRQERLEDFEYSYNRARDTWDNFDKQADLLTRIRIKDMSIWDPNWASLLPRFVYRRFGPFTGRNSMDASGYLTARPLISGEEMSHELAHLWHLRLDWGRRMDFEKRWGDISENHYSRRRNATSEDYERNGAVSRYGSTNINEDVAETCGFVYRRANFETEPFKKNLSPKYWDKVERKLALLREYDFFSEREHQIVLGKLNEFRERVYKN